MPLSPRRPSASERLQRARERHVALQRRRIAATSSAASVVSGDQEEDERHERHERHERDDATIAETLVEQLHGLAPCEQLAALHKVGSPEKDALVVHLMARVASLEAQRNDVAALGERIAAQLVQQQVGRLDAALVLYTVLGVFTVWWLVSVCQHELRREHDATVARLEEQLRCHPELRRLEHAVATLQDARRETERQLQLAAQRLHRSRKREKELRQQQDPLWDI
ncbi:hypothetical protein ATCC90586_001624 [Pythium insidiosum]|nr:hypothetical protein ATCC90586_001624 [Pythium insidiosum]